MTAKPACQECLPFFSARKDQRARGVVCSVCVSTHLHETKRIGKTKLFSTLIILHARN